MEEIHNYIKINDWLSTAGLPTKEQFEIIGKNGFEVVINLATTEKNNLEDEGKIVGDLNMVYFHIPVTWNSPEQDRLKLFLKILKLLHQNGKKVFIHCIKNYRVSAFVYIFRRDVLKENSVKLIKPEDFEPNEIWKIIIEQKSFID
ncbi:MAG: protein tyrosine phosphatase family protein [Campylobacterales bacterium]|nr:protein tyrosine phosphatase family protein [Campylobacterales bacterium]